GRGHRVRRGARDGGRLRRRAAGQRDLARGRPRPDGTRDADGGAGRPRSVRGRPHPAPAVRAGIVTGRRRSGAVLSGELEPVQDLASAWLGAWAADGAFADCCATDVQYEDPLAVDPLRGLSALQDHRKRIRAAFPDLKLERTGTPLNNGAYACIPWRAAGTHSSGSSTVPATNRFLTLHGLHY